MTVVGIHDLSIATASRVLDLALLAERAGIDPDKYRIGLGQDQMSVPAPDEDIVTMAAAAALPIVERHGASGIRTVLFATESGVDQSKSAAVFVHELLGLDPATRVVELKQACYSATAALQFALGIVARQPEESVLVIAADVARYAVDTAAEPTQGAGAVAMLVTQNPAIAEVEPATGIHTADVDDFWRPNDSDTAVVNGKLSIDAYLDAFVGAWDDYRARGGAAIESIDYFCHHQPFTRMAVKAHQRLAVHTGAALTPAQMESTTRYNRRLGNSYTASLYFALAALLDGEDDVTDRRVGMYSYGSGSIGEFFSLRIRPGYRTALRTEATKRILDSREPLDVDAYRALHAAHSASSEVDREIAPTSPAPFHFIGVQGRARRYARTDA